MKKIFIVFFGLFLICLNVFAVEQQPSEERQSEKIKKEKEQKIKYQKIDKESVNPSVQGEFGTSSWIPFIYYRRGYRRY